MDIYTLMRSAPILLALLELPEELLFHTKNLIKQVAGERTSTYDRIAAAHTLHDILFPIKESKNNGLKTG